MFVSTNSVPLMCILMFLAPAQHSKVRAWSQHGSAVFASIVSSELSWPTPISLVVFVPTLHIMPPSECDTQLATDNIENDGHYQRNLPF